MSTKHQGKSRVIYTAKDSLDTVLPQQDYCIIFNTI
nr:MAG TPA: major vault protein-like protein [Caudoviricetes sp.]